MSRIERHNKADKTNKYHGVWESSKKRPETILVTEAVVSVVAKAGNSGKSYSGRERNNPLR